MSEVTNESAADPAESAEQRVPLSVHARTAGCGFLMGAADIVPGVSGGTVALILGVYERLVSAISRCDATVLSLVAHRKFREAAERMDLKFVLALGTGIATGIAGLASVMHYLLANHMSFTFAVFSGMILASTLLVARRIESWQEQHFAILIIGILFALRVVTLPFLQNPPDTLWYMFLCGVIGITAMILPGISGAFILLLLGRYHDITESLKGILHGQISMDVITSLAVFAVGCLTGLLGFSRVLRWLLAKYHDPTMAALCGFMVGSLYKLWPFQEDLTPHELKFKEKIFAPVLPAGGMSEIAAAAVLCVAGAAVVLTLDIVARRGEQAEST